MTASRFGITGLYTIASVLDVKESMNYDHTIFPNPNLFFLFFVFALKGILLQTLKVQHRDFKERVTNYRHIKLYNNTS